MIILGLILALLGLVLSVPILWVVGLVLIVVGPRCGSPAPPDEASVAGATTTDAPAPTRPASAMHQRRSKAPSSTGPSSSQEPRSFVVTQPSTSSCQSFGDTEWANICTPWRRAGQHVSSVGTPAWPRRSAYSMSSSRKPSAPPTMTSAGGSPERSVARAAAAV